MLDTSDEMDLETIVLDGEVNAASKVEKYKVAREADREEEVVMAEKMVYSKD